MHDDNGWMRAAIEAELVTATEETARLGRELDALESELARIVDLFLQATGRTDLAADFLGNLGHPRPTLH